MDTVIQYIVNFSFISKENIWFGGRAYKIYIFKCYFYVIYVSTIGTK